MIKVHYVMTMAVFTTQMKKELDELINDLPFGSHIYVQLDPVSTPFDEYELEEQIRCCYGPNENEILLFETPKSTQVDMHKKNSSKSAEVSEESILDLVVNSQVSTLDYPDQVRAWLLDWVHDHENIMAYYRFVVRPLTS